MLPVRKTRRIALIVLAAFAICVLLLFLHSAGGESALARYKAELRAKGDKLTFAEFALPPSTNAVQVASHNIFATNKFSYGGPEIQLREYVVPGKVKVAWRGKTHSFPANSGQASSDKFIVGDWSELDAMIKRDAPKLDQFRAALVDPAPDFGWNYADTVQNFTNSWSVSRNYVAFRGVLFGLAHSALGEMHKGKREKSLADLITITRLAQFDRNDLVLVPAMIRPTIVDYGTCLTWQALQMPGWTDGQLKALQDGWEGVDILDPIEISFMSERANIPLIAELIRRAPGGKVDAIFGTFSATPSRSALSAASLKGYWQEHILPMVYKMTALNEDELLAMKQMTAEIDCVRMLKADRQWPEISLSLSNRAKEFEHKILGKGRICPYYISALAVPSLTHAWKRIGAAESERRLAITAIAIKRYELKYRKPPPSLGALVPEFLTSALTDLMGGKPLCYRLRDDGMYVLYSVGFDGKDDGGDPTPADPNSAAGLWEGRDAVWPTAASDEEVAKEEAEEQKSEAKAKAPGK